MHLNKHFYIRVNRVLNSIKENGFFWTTTFILRRISINCYIFFEKRLIKIEERKFIKGWNSISQNKLTWDKWNWNNKGEEWTISSEWKDKFVSKIIYEHIKPGSVILEVGPGAGRWTTYLMNLAERLYLVDISQKCIEICKKKFQSENFIEFLLLKEICLDKLKNSSLDCIFSYDVFVHIDYKDIEKYFSEFKEKISKDGKIIIHYSRVGDKLGKFRSRFNEDDFKYLLKKYNFKVINIYDNLKLEEIESYNASKYNEVISILKKI